MVRRPEDEPPLGWISLDSVLQPSATVRAYAARGQGVRGVCNVDRGCRRTVELDPDALCKGGLGNLSMRQVEQTFRCHRLDGCVLRFHDQEAALELRLSMLTGKAHVRVRLRCRGCGLVRTFLAEDVITRLRAASKGDPDTLVKDLPKLISGACPAESCKKSNWSVDVLWARTESMGWQRLGARLFEGAG